MRNNRGNVEETSVRCRILNDGSSRFVFGGRFFRIFRAGCARFVLFRSIEWREGKRRFLGWEFYIY